jgi:hypothetical protein
MVNRLPAKRRDVYVVFVEAMQHAAKWNRDVARRLNLTRARKPDQTLSPKNKSDHVLT